MKTVRLVLSSAALAAALALAGCFGPPSPSPSPSASSPSASASSPSASASASTSATPSTTTSATTSTTTSASPAPSSSSATASPPATTAPTTTAPATTAPATTAPATEPPGAGPTELPEQTAPLTIYYIAPNDGGISGPAVGCGDSAVATYTEPVTFRDQVGPSMRRLLANHSSTVGQSGLTNPLYQSNLTYVAGSFDGTTITVYLTGTFQLGGVCDIPRVEAQLNLTAAAAAGAQRAAVFVNGRPLAEVLSLK